MHLLERGATHEADRERLTDRKIDFDAGAVEPKSVWRDEVVERDRIVRNVKWLSFRRPVQDPRLIVERLGSLSSSKFPGLQARVV